MSETFAGKLMKHRKWSQFLCGLAISVGFGTMAMSGFNLMGQWYTGLVIIAIALGSWGLTRSVFDVLAKKYAGTLNPSKFV